MPDKVDQLYDALKADGAVKNSRENFRGFMFAPGKQGYNNRLQLYKSLRADGAIKSKSYEEFRDKLGIGAVNPQRKQQASAAIGGTASQATQPVQNNMTNWANPVDATDMRSEWEKQQKPKAQKPNIATETQKAVRGEGEGAKRLRAATQQLKDRADYQKETGKELKSPVDLTSVGVTPTLARDEQGAVMKDENGNPLVGFESNSAKANVQRQEEEKKRLQEQLEEAYAEREKLDAEIEKGRESAANRLLGGMLPGNQEKSGYNDADMEQSNLLSAKRLLDRRITALEAANNNSGFWGGTKDQLKDPTSWSFGLSDAEDALVMANLKKKIDAAGGDTSKLTEGERLLAENYLKNQEAQKLNEDRDWWYNAGQGFGQSLSFMKDFALSGGGFANIAKAGMRYGAKKGAQLASKTLGNYMTKNLGTKALGKTIETIGKGAGLVAGTEAGGLLLNNTVQAASSAADIINKNTGNLTYGKDGNLTFEGGESLGKAILTSQLSRTGENASELFGLAFDKVPGILGKVIQRTTPGKVLKNIANNKAWKAGEKGLGYLGVQSVWGEGMEEEYGMLRTEILNTLTNGEYEPNGSGILDINRQLDTWANVGLTSMLLRVPAMIASGTNTANYYANKYNLNSSDKNMRSTFGNDERYNVVKTAIDEADNNQLAGVLSNLMTKSDLTNEEKQAMLTYANDLVKMRGFNIGNVVAAANGYAEPPRVSNYNIRGLHVDEVDKDGNIINSYDYDNADDLKTGLYEMQQNRADQTLQSDLMVMKARPDNQYQAFVDSYCEQFGVEPEELEEMLAKPSMERTEAEQSIVAPFADSLHNVVYDNSVLHEEQSQQDGEDLADVLSLDLSNLNEEQALEAQKLTDEYKEAENALQELYKSGENGENIKEEIENMAGQPAQSIVSSLETFSPKSVDTVIGYYNAKAKLDGFINRMKRKISEEAANRRERHTFTGTINGQEDKTNIVNISDGTNTYTLVSGNITTDGDGRITGSDTGLIIALDENGDFVQLSDTSEYGIVPSYMTLDQYQAQQEEELQLQMTSAIDPEGKLMEEQGEATAGGEETESSLQESDLELWPEVKKWIDENPDAKIAQLQRTFGIGFNRAGRYIDEWMRIREQGGNNADVEAGGENTGADEASATAPFGTALDRIPKDEQGNPIYEQGTPEDTYDAINEQAGDSAQILIKNQLDAAKKRHDKLVKEKEAGKLKGKTVQEQIAEIKELQDKIDAEDALVKFWTKVMTVPNNRRADEEVKAPVEETPQTGETINETNEESAPDWSVDKASDARARGYRMENGYRVDRQQPITEKVEGNDTEVKFDKAEEPVKGKITVVEGGTLIPSHVNGQRNVMFFIDEAQPKERTDVDSEASSNRIAEKVNPEEITGGVTAYTGSPVVNSRGEVIQGNNRTIGMQKMWNNAAYEESQKKYKQYLIDHAEEFGLDPKQIEKMNNPVMVRMVDVADDEAIRLGQKTAANTESGGKERIDPQRVIQQMGDNFRVFTNQLFSGEIEDQTLLSIIAENGVKVLKWLNDGTNHPKYITDTQFQSCFDNKGNLTEEAKTDLRRIVENMLFRDAPERLSDMFYKMPAKAQNAILSTIWRDSQSEKNDRIIKDIQSSIGAFTVINGASEEFRGAKDVNTARAAVKDLQKQTQMFGDTETVLEKFSNFALELAILYKGAKQNDIRGYFNAYFDAVQGKGGSLFESSEKKTKEQAINDIYGIDINENENGTEGSNTLESSDTDGTTGEPNNEGEPAVGESVEEGEQPPVSGTGTETNGEVSEREQFIAGHPLTVEQIDASDAPAMRKSLAKRYLDGNDESELAKAAYTSIYNKVSAQPATQEESTQEAPSTQSNATLEAQAKVSAILARMKRNRRPQGDTDAYSIQNLTSEQIDDMLELVEAGAELGYSILGTVNSKTEWMNQMRGMIGEQLKDATGYTDQEVDELLNDLWNSPYAVDGVGKTVGEWAAEEGINTEDNGTEEVNGNATQGDVPGSDVVGGSTETGMGEETENEGGDTGTNREEGVGNNVQGRNEETGTGKPSNGTGQRTGSTGKTGSSTGRGRTNSGANGGRGTNAEGGTAATGEQPSVPAAGESSVGQPQRVELTDLSKEKTPYKPASIGGKYAIGSVIPSGIADAITNAFKRLKEIFKKKSVLDIVREELGYKTNEEMLSDFDSGKTDGLAAEQVDAVALAIGKMKEGKSFIVGDMTGVGKGRTAAALIRWGLQHKKKVLFVTEKSGLFSDMYRDLTDIGCDYLPFVTNNDSEANITDSDGVKVVPKPQAQAQNALWQSDNDKLPTNKKGRQYDFVMTTYSQASNPVGANGKNKLEWLKQYAKDAIVIMDESHNASGESNRGEFFKELVKNAGGVTFLSATYAKRPDNMLLYAMRSSMSELHMAVGDMLQAIKDYGVAMQELMASALFGNGEMIRRERDMSDVKTTWTEPKNVYSEEEYEQCRKTSDKTMELINDIIQFQRDYVNPIVKNHEDGFKDQNEKNALIGAPQTHATNTSYKSQVSNVVGLMVYAMKAKKAAQMAIEQIKQGKRPVIAVENTLDSYIKELDGEIKDATFGPVFDKGVRFSLKYTIAQYELKNGKASKIEGSEQVFDAESELDEDGARALANLRQRILDYIGDKDKVELSLSPIDLIKQMIADAGYTCGEITGRSTQLEKRGDVYVKTPFKTKKKDAARKFNGGSSTSPLPENEQYQALVVNVAGATGISLHSSKKFGNQNPRTMIILQPARDVNTEVQMRGRIDRTGQVHRGEYFYLTSPIPAEQKMTMMLKQKLASLDAQSVGTKNVSSNKVESQDMDNKYGDEVCYQFLLEHLQDINAFLEDGLKYNNKTREWEGRPGLLYDVLKNLQRLPCDMQEMVINELSERYADQIDYLNQNGINDLETTTMNLEAVTIDKATFVKGKDNESTNEFAHDTSLERVEVNVLKKPMRSSDIKKKMKELGSLDEDGLPKEGVLSDVETRVREVVDNLFKAREDKYKEQEAKLEEKIRKDHPQKEGMDDDVYENMITNWPTLAEMRQKHKADLASYGSSLQEQFNKIYRAAMYLKPGRPYLVPLTDDIGNDAALMYGRFIGFQLKNGDPRQVQAVFAVKDSRSMITVPVVNKSNVIDRILRERNDMEIVALQKDEYQEELPMDDKSKKWDEWWDKMIPKNTSRQIRFMITGNVLQACGSLGKYKGQIVTFTRKDKDTGEITVERGMLLAENFDPENFKVRREVTKKDIWDNYGETKDERSGISCHREGSRMIVKFDKRKGEKLSDHPAQKDDALKGLAMNGEIRPSGKTAILCVIKEDNVEKALEHLYKEYGYTKEELFIMPDSTEKPDAIVPSNRPYQEVIDELSPKYGSEWTVDSKIRKMLKRYKMDVNNESLVNDIKEAVTLRQAYLRKRYASGESNRLAWQVLVEDQWIERYSDDKEERERHMRIREAILEELAFRGFKGNAYHYTQGKITTDDVRKMFDTMNDTSTSEGKAKKALFEKVMEKVNKLPMEIFLSEKIDNDTGGWAGGRVINYNWKYMNADYIADQAKADTILHELIHTVTAYADNCVENGLEHLLDQDMIDAINELHSIFEAIKNDDTFTHDGTRAYGLTNVREMLSEAGSNSEFREDLKKTNLWARLKAGFLAFFGIKQNVSGGKQVNAYEQIMERLEYLIENFKQEAWDEYYRGSQYGGYGYRKKDSQKIDTSDPMQAINNAAEDWRESSETIFNAAKNLFGTTTDVREAGYVLPDGTMLDFSGRHLMDEGSDTSGLKGRRTTDHREISSIAYGKDGWTETGIETDMPDFIRRGAIRIDDNAGTINLAVRPTEEQLAVLRKIVSRNDGEVQVDFGDGWDSEGYIEYDEGTKPQRVFADINRFFERRERRINEAQRRFDEDIDEPYTDEEQRIIDEAKKNGTYMKAPNGKKSNLSPKQWVRVRTGSFKKWFGDWEKAIRIDKLRRSKPVVIDKRDYEGKYPLDADSAQKWIKDNLRGEYTIDDTHETVLLSKVGAEEVTSHSRHDDAHLKSISSIPKMLKDAIFIEERPKGKDNSKFDSYRYYVVGLKIDGVDYTAKIVIGVKQGKKYYDHRLTEIEKTELIDLVNQPAPDFTTAGNASLPPYIGSKDTKLNEILQTNSSKIVDENGEPMVMSHRTDNEGFYTFDKERIGTGQGQAFLGNGFNFSRGLGNSIYGKRNILTFLNAKKPLRSDRNTLTKGEIRSIIQELNAQNSVDRIEDNWGGSINEAVNAIYGYGGDLDTYATIGMTYSGNPNDVMDAFAKRGFDSTIEYDNDGSIMNAVVFEPNQIKSATENNGDYSSENPDIRFSEGKATKRKNNTHKQRIAEHVDALAEKLGTRARTTVYHSLSEVPEGLRQYIEEAHKRGRKVRGWYENGQIYLFLPDINSTYEAEKTIWHETVAHHGLRQLVGDENLDKLLRQLWLTHKDGAMGKWVTERMTRNGWALNEAIEEYLAREAEKNPFKEPTLWQRVRWMLADILHSMGFASDPTISDVQYLFWLSQNRLNDNDPLGSIKRQAFLYRLERAARESAGNNQYVNLNAERVEDIYNPEAQDAYDDGRRHSEETDEEVIERLDREPKIKAYRAMQLIDGKLYPPMAAKQGGKLVNPIELGKWEKADEHPEMADENGKFKLDKGNGKSLKAAYNPYIHTSTTMLNDQFSEAQSRPNLVVVEVEVPESELTSGYKAEKAKDSVGRLEWKAGPIQGQLTGTREVILSRWDKPVRIVPAEEVAKHIYDMIKGQVDVMPTNVVTPQQREELEKLGVQFVETDNRGFLKEGENVGKSYSSVYGKKASRRFDEDIDEPVAHSARAVYEDRLNRVETMFSEAYQDSMISLKVGQNAIAKDKDIPDSQNAYMAENLMHGKNKNEQDLFNLMFRDPLIKTINKIMDLTGMNWGDVDRYVYTKSGLERNREFYVRDWLEANKDKDGVDDIRDKWLALKEKADNIDESYTFADYLEELTDFIKKNINAKYDPSKHDYSGFRAMFGEDYDESEIIDDLMNTETEIGDDVNTLWEQINACTKYGLDRYKEAGLKSEEQIENVKKMFHWYVPMRGFKEDTGEDMYQYFTGKGRTKNYVGGLLKHAKGRGSEASYPISTIFAMTYKAIADCNQNLVNQKFYRLCQANKNDLVVLSDSWVNLNETTGEWEEVWPQITDDMSEEEIRQATIDFEKEMNGLADEDKAKKIKGKPNFAYKPIDKDKKNEHVVEVWMNGQKKLATVVGNPRMAQALNGQLRFERGHNIFSKWNADIKNFMSSLFTSYSPTFALRNMLRDWTHFRTMLIVREGEGYAHAAGKYYAQQMPKMMSLFKKYREGTLGDSEMERDFKDFMDSGGITGFVQMNKIDEIQKEMEKLHKQMKDGKVIKLNNKVWDYTLGAVEAFNEAIENNARFATYRASRHYANRTKARSAYDAKEITVNFNRKGAGSKTAGFKGSSRVEHAAQLAGITSQILGEGRIFFNATVQAIATTFKNFQNPDGSLNKPYIAKWAAKYAAPPFLFGLALPFINQMLAAAFGGDDDDPYGDLPEWTRRKNLCIYIGNNNFITIPVGQELAAFLSLGDMVAGYTYDPNLRPVDRSFTEDMAGIMNTFSPIDVDTKITKGGITRDPMSEITGRTFSVLAPLVAVEQNLSWTGRPIYREDVFKNDYLKPEYQMVYSGTNPVLVGASKILHELGGGDDITRGKMEVNPAIVQYLWEQYTGGPGKVFSNTISIGKDAKDILQGKESDFNIRKVEGLKAFVQQGDDRTEYYRVKAKYRKYKEDADKLYNDIKGYKSLASEDPTAKMKLDRLMKGEEYARMKIAREAEKHLAKIRKSADALEGAEKKKRMKEYNKLVKEVVDRLDDVQ